MVSDLEWFRVFLRGCKRTRQRSNLVRLTSPCIARGFSRDFAEIWFFSLFDSFEKHVALQCSAMYLGLDLTRTILHSKGCLCESVCIKSMDKPFSPHAVQCKR